MQSTGDTPQTAFKTAELRWRGVENPLNEHDLIDLGGPIDGYKGSWKAKSGFKVSSWTLPGSVACPPNEWKMWECEESDAVVLKGVFDANSSLRWVGTALREWPSPPNVTNLTALLGAPERWDGPGIAAVIDPWNACVQHVTGAKRKRTTETNSAVVTSGGSVQYNVPKMTTKAPLRALRWITLGHHYDWTADKYNPSRKVTEMPETMVALSKAVVEAAGDGEQGYDPQAAIVNFYQGKTRMNGHVDDSEFVPAPVVSFSFGAPAVFLLGADRDRSVTPQAILIRSGDVIIMRKRSRFAVHGVPRVLPELLPAELMPSSLPPRGMFAAAASYLEQLGGRVNINVRQVTSVAGLELPSEKIY